MSMPQEWFWKCDTCKESGMSDMPPAEGKRWENEETLTAAKEHVNAYPGHVVQRWYQEWLGYVR